MVVIVAQTLATGDSVQAKNLPLGFAGEAMLADYAVSRTSASDLLCKWGESSLTNTAAQMQHSPRPQL